MNPLLSLHLKAFDWLDHHWESPRSTRWISNLVVGFFILGSVVPLLIFLDVPIPFPSLSPFFAVEIAFTILLVFEILGLIFLLPKSVADSIGKQFEIISLLLLRDAFKEFGRTQKHQKITQSNEEQSEFIGVKKILSLYLALVFFMIVVLDISRALNTGVVSFSIQSFYTLLIFTDIFILIFSLRYSSKYYNLFRYSSFALATLFLRLTISAPAYYNVLLAVIAGGLVLGVTAIYNGLLLKDNTSKNLT
jgi:hypothetical protein